MHLGERRQRIDAGCVKEILRHDIELADGNLIVGKWGARARCGVEGLRVVQLNAAGHAGIGGVQKIREIALPPRHRHEGGGVDAGRRGLAQALVIHEDEQFVLPDGAAEGAAELVPADGRTEILSDRPIPRPVIGVEYVVAEVLKRIAVVLVGARFDHHVDDAALEIAELGRGVVGDHVEFRDGVGIRLIARQIIRRLVIIHAIQQEVITLFPVAVDVRSAAAGGAHSTRESRRVRRGDARRQQCQRDRVPADLRDVGDGVRADHRPDLCRFGLQQRGFGRNRNRLGESANLHWYIQTCALIDLESQCRFRRRLEAFGLDFQRIGAHRNARERVDPVFVGFRGPFRAAIQVLRRYRSADNGASRGVGHPPSDAGADLLRVGCPWAQTHEPRYQYAR